MGGRLAAGMAGGVPGCPWAAGGPWAGAGGPRAGGSGLGCGRGAVASGLWAAAAGQVPGMCADNGAGGMCDGPSDLDRVSRFNALHFPPPLHPLPLFILADSQTVAYPHPPQSTKKKKKSYQ